MREYVVCTRAFSLQSLFVCNSPVISVFHIFPNPQGKSLSAGCFLVRALCITKCIAFHPADLIHDPHYHYQHHG